MRDFAVHREAGAPRGWRRLLRLPRRLLVRILLPIFRRLAALLEDLDADQRRLQEQQRCMARQLEGLLNHGWDQAALSRRLAALEREVDLLKEHLAAEPANAAPPGPARMSG